MRKLFELLNSQGAVPDVSIEFARFMEELAGDSASPELYQAALLASYMVTAGRHSCFDLQSAAGSCLSEILDNIPEELRSESAKQRLPRLDDWLEALRNSTVVAEPGEKAPLILDEDRRLYLYRYWEYEKNLAESILERAGRTDPSINLEDLGKILPRYFFENGNSTDWQKLAAFMGTRNYFTVITGGPGTGKTTTVTAVLASILELAEDPGKLRIALLAPTGKAAVRLQESISGRLGNLPLSPALRDTFPSEVMTIHRFLGAVPNSPYFRHNKLNPVPVDIVIADEASMIPLHLMAKLFDALSPDAKIILLGDRKQLASVESGAVMGGICNAVEGINSFPADFISSWQLVSGETLEDGHLAGKPQPLSSNITTLTHSYRFSGDEGIGILSELVNSGRGEEAFNLLEKDNSGKLEYLSLPSGSAMRGAVSEVIKKYFLFMKTCSSPEEAFEKLGEFKILCATRNGLYGVNWINSFIEQNLAGAGKPLFYHGRPVMINSNHPELGLFNGDIGITWKTQDENLRVYFPDKNGDLRSFSPAGLPGHETAYALTIHKSQGSEFDKVLIILPDRISPILTRELIYTGITRARKQVAVWTEKEIFIEAAGKITCRSSGLADRLGKDL